MSDSGEPLQSEPVCSFIRKPTKNKNIRKRPVGDDDDDDNENVNSESFTTHKLRKAPKPDNKLHFSSVGSSKKPETEEPTSGHDTAFHFESSKIIQVQHDSRATATLETETEFDRDARAIRERTLKQAEESLKGSMKTEEKLYKGIHGYTDYKAGFRREQTVSGEKAGGSHGPLRASAHIRVSARFDYQPDICKDYKETGYCGFGDACKFMHDRGDYKSGWQLEKEWEEVEKARKRNLALGRDDSDGEGRDESEDEDDDSLPFRCLMCRIHFKEVKNPVVTQCKHYFCEKCALEHHSRNKKCYICNKPTMGIFNIAHEIKKKIAESKQ